LRINSNQLWDVTHLQSFVSFTTFNRQKVLGFSDMPFADVRNQWRNKGEFGASE